MKVLSIHYLKCNEIEQFILFMLLVSNLVTLHIIQYIPFLPCKIL